VYDFGIEGKGFPSESQADKIFGLVEAWESGALPSHKILHLLADRKALGIRCGPM
jgi:hypothetical protein